MTTASFNPQLSVGGANPRREIVIGSAAIAIFFGGFVCWAALAPLDLATHGAGLVTVTGNRQVIQPAQGGSVSAILVHEGERVVAGQPLLEFDANDLRATERAFAERVIQRRVEIARLNAERAGGEIRPFPDLAKFSAPDQARIAEVMIDARRELADRLATRRTEKSVLRQRIDQLSSQISGANGQIDSTSTQKSLISQELDGMRRLEAQGYAPGTRVRALERNIAEIEGEANARRAEVARLSSGIGEVRLQIGQVDQQYTTDITRELHEAESDLATTQADWVAARTRLEASQLRAPVAGTVMSLGVNTIGAAVGVGQKVAEIVPADPYLSMEVRFNARDVEGITAGQEAQVRFVSLRGRNSPLLHGRIVRVSPDSITDEKTGAVFYTASVSVSPTELRRLDRVAGRAGEVRPGLPIEAVVTLRKRTLLEAIFEPLTASLWRQGG
jgi:HlyD family type I secretion membrane fusion protein